MYCNNTQQSKHTFLNHALFSDFLKYRGYKLKKKKEKVLRVLNSSIIIWEQLIATSHSARTSHTGVLQSVQR